MNSLIVWLLNKLKFTLSSDKLLSNIRSKMLSNTLKQMFPNVKCFHMACQLLFCCRYQEEVGIFGNITWKLFLKNIASFSYTGCQALYKKMPSTFTWHANYHVTLNTKGGTYFFTSSVSLWKNAYNVTLICRKRQLILSDMQITTLLSIIF